MKNFNNKRYWRQDYDTKKLVNNIKPRMKLRSCNHCGRIYIYNTATGSFGMICPKCYKSQVDKCIAIS